MVATHTSDGNKRKVPDTDTTNIYYSHKLLINRLIPEIIPVSIPPIDPTIADGVMESIRTLNARQTITSKEIVTDAARSGALVFQDPTVVNQKDMDGKIPPDRNTIVIHHRSTTPVRMGNLPLVSPTSISSQDIEIPRRSIGPKEVRNVEPLDISINGIFFEYKGPAPT